MPEQAPAAQESLPAGLVQVQVLAPESELPAVAEGSWTVWCDHLWCNFGSLDSPVLLLWVLTSNGSSRIHDLNHLHLRTASKMNG